MPNEQVKGTLLAVGATAASTALLVGGIIDIHNTYESATGVDPSTVIDFRAKQASDAAAGGTGEFSDHCLVMREGYMIAVPSASWTTDEQSNPVMDALPQTLNWQWVNTTRQSPGWSTFLDPLTVGNTYPKVATPDGRTQDNLNEWFDVIKKHVPGSYPVPGMLQVGYKADSRPQHVLAAHCEWDMTVSSHADRNVDGPTLSDNVTIGAAGQERDESASWLVVNGEKAQVTVHGRAYRTADKPVKGNDVPADAQLIGETTLDFAAPGTKTATINKPSNLDGGYVTWVWTVEKNNQPGDWGKYLINDTVSDGWAAENEVVELPKAPKPTPSVAAPTIEPSAAPAPSDVTPSPEPSATTPAPSPSESQALPPAPATSSTPTTPTQANTPSGTPANPAQSTPATPKIPETQASLAHTGSVAAPLIEASVVMLAGGLTIALRKRNTI